MRHGQGKEKFIVKAGGNRRGVYRTGPCGSSAEEGQRGGGQQ